MSDFKNEYELWDEFLNVWPLARLSTMTLDEYTQAGSKDSFTRWIEARLEKLGSIWGGSSFKFGVFSRKDTDDKTSDTKLSYSDTHGWYSSLGASAEDAFLQVRSHVAQVATLAANGDLDGIEKFEHLGEAYKWKIAFQYQNRQSPVIVGIFKKAPLAVFVGDTAASSMAVLQQAAVTKRPTEIGILEFGRQIWEAWSKKNLAIWKLSHGVNDFSVDERQHYVQAELGVMHGDTAKGQGADFKKIPIGTLFYLCHGNESLPLVGQFTSDALPCDKGDGWLQRGYRVLKPAVKKGGYQSGQKGWTPNYRSTFKIVGAHDLPEFENSILKPFFSTDLAELATLAGEPIDVNDAPFAINEDLSDAGIFRRFDVKPEFKELRKSWNDEDSAAFCNFARSIHAVGLDWWHTNIQAMQIRFGRTQPGRKKSDTHVLGYVFCNRRPAVYVNNLIDGIQSVERSLLVDEAVVDLKKSLLADKNQVQAWNSINPVRDGLWPDQLMGVDLSPDSESESMEFKNDLAISRGQAVNRIYYGPPGTGKTYTLLQLLKREYEQQVALISPEEWRSQIIAEKIAALKWWEGAAAALYDLGGKAKVADIAEHRFIQTITAANGSNRNVRQTLWRTLQNHTVDESATVKMKKRLSPAVFDKSTDSVWQFAGEWQEASADLIALVEHIKQGPQNNGAVQRYSFVTFHQSYGYEEFVEGLRPVLTGEAEGGEVGYEIRPGAFKELCRKARQSPDQRFAMVIDEINRGNISKIFGELITLIEPDKRDPLNGNAPPLELTLAYSGEKFSVPANVDVIGTMNTADRSLALLDTALRRRFDFVPLLPDTRAEKVPSEPHSAPLAGLVVTTDSGPIDVRLLLERINERIEALYDRDHCIGHAYLTVLADVTDGPARFDKLADIFRKRIVPLLEEYFFEDWRKIRLVLGDNRKPDEVQFITESDAQEQDLSELFGNEHGLDSYATKRRYRPQPSAFAEPAAYLGIYKASA